MFKFLKYYNGYIFKYMNNTQDLILHETLVFGINNCYIVDFPSNFL